MIARSIVLIPSMCKVVCNLMIAWFSNMTTYGTMPLQKLSSDTMYTVPRAQVTCDMV